MNSQQRGLKYISPNYRVLAAAAFLVLSVSVLARAQSSPIPSETSGPKCPQNGPITDVTQCSGYKTRADMNAALSGGTQINPQLGPGTTGQFSGIGGCGPNNGFTLNPNGAPSCVPTSTPSASTPTPTTTITPIPGPTPTPAPNGMGGTQLNAPGYDNIINVKNYRASGSNLTYTCSINANSLSCTVATDFQLGQYIAIPTAGSGTPISGTPGTPVLTNLGATGSTTDCYELVAGDPAEGLSASGTAACVTNGPAAGAYTILSGVQVTVPAGSISSANVAYGIYRSIAGGTYNLINVSTGDTYKDYGQDLGKSFDWPASYTTSYPGRNQTLYTMIAGGSGTSWVTATAATNAASSVSVRHDDTVALQAAYDAAAGKTLYLPSGTYHVNMIQLINSSGPTRGGYVFNSTTDGYNSAGSLQVNGSNILTRGAGMQATIIKRDYAWIRNIRAPIWNVAPAAWYGYTGPQPGSGGGCTLTSYAVNNATHGSTSITTTTAGNAANFNPGDIVFIANGGQTVDGSFTAFTLTKVKAVNTSSGTIALADALTTDVPWGSGTSACIEDLTTNNVAQEQVNFRDLTISSPGPVFSENVTYNSEIQHIYESEDPTYFVELMYNEWSSGLYIHDNPKIEEDTQEFPLATNLRIENNGIRERQPGKAAAIDLDGAATPASFKDNVVALACGSGFGFDGSVAEADIGGNVFWQMCPQGTSAQDTATITYGTTAGGGLGYSWRFHDNHVDSTSYSMTAVSSIAAPTPPNFVVSNNTYWWVITTSAADGVGMATGSSGQVVDNTMTVTADGNGNPEGLTLQPLCANANPPSAKGNTMVMLGTPEGTSIEVRDPGNCSSAYYLNGILVESNLSQGFSTNTPLIGSATDTPNVIIASNYPPASPCLSGLPTAISSNAGNNQCWTFALLGSGATATLGQADPPSGYVYTDKGGSRFCTWFVIGGGSGSVTKIDDPFSTCGTTAGSSGKIDLYYVSSTLTIDNNTSDTTNALYFNFFTF